MNESDKMPKTGNWLLRLLFIYGPGIFCVGYTIGTGSVTSMIVAGSEHGMGLLWVLALSCLFSGVLMEAYGRFALVTGWTSISIFRSEFGRFFAILVALMIVLGQWTCLSGLVGLSSGAVVEGIQMFFPQIGHWAVVITAAILLLSAYLLLWFGNYKRFETVLVLLVTMMGLSFILSLFYVHPTAVQVVNGFLPTVPDSAQEYLMIAAFVGTTMAAPTFVVRPILLKAKGWTSSDRSLQTKDVIVSAVIMFIVSASIMACSTGAILNQGGQPVQSINDMIETLRPLAGDFAAGVFLIGAVAAGLSSLFPIMMVAPLMTADYCGEGLNAQTRTFRILAGIACLIGMTVPILGANPVFVQVLTQVSQVFVLPLVIGGITILVNRPSVMGKHRAGFFLNAGLFFAFFFSLIISYCGIIAISKTFGGF
ncbi:MAG: Nramp family divalent metal transporter [Planctomycetaceae bacterium]|jgi:Mn2+/Fe2+ NRAMP family transporter|nr:Nramp family divalent metal transporter [Planctomycetaceae bacterium]